MAPHRAGRLITPGGHSLWQVAALEIRWIAHSWFQIKAGGTVVHIDPSDLGSRRLEALPKDVEKADLILITHHHADHCRKDFVTLVSKDGTHVLAPKACSEKLGGGMVVMKPGDSFRDDGFTVRALDAYNTPEGASTTKAHRKGEGLGYLVTAVGKTVYHAGDTDMIPEMADFGPMDVALLPIGGTYTMDAAEAARTVAKIKPKIAIPMHHIDADPGDFTKRVGKKARVVVLRPGEALSLAPR